MEIHRVSQYYYIIRTTIIPKQYYCIPMLREDVCENKIKYTHLNGRTRSRAIVRTLKIYKYVYVYTYDNIIILPCSACTHLYGYRHCARVV